MVSDDIELGREYFCREETSEKGYAGVFRIDESRIETRLHCFDAPVSLGDEKNLVLRLENNRFVTLHDSFSTGGGGSHDLREPKLSTYAKRVDASIAIIGRDAWHESDPIRRVNFKIAHTDDLLHHTAKFDAIADAELGDIPDPTIFELKVAGMKLTAWYTASGNFNFKRATTIGLRYGLEFDEPVTMRSYLTWVECIVRFNSAALGHHFVPSGIEISRFSADEYTKAVEDQIYLGDHAVRYIWPETPLPERSLWVGHSFAHGRNDAELAAFVDCLRVWIERHTIWQNATNLMMTAFTLRNVISPERLLTACKWLEEIPDAASEFIVSADDINKIAACAAVEAERLGHGEFKERVAGVIRGQLKTETNAQRFGRLVDSVRARFGEKALGKTIVEDLVKATKFRAKVAHGHFSPADDDEFNEFQKSMFALEALCYLLTVRDLPMSLEGAERAPGAEIARNHRLWL